MHCPPANSSSKAFTGFLTKGKPQRPRYVSECLVPVHSCNTLKTKVNKDLMTNASADHPMPNSLGSVLGIVLVTRTQDEKAHDRGESDPESELLNAAGSAAARGWLQRCSKHEVTAIEHGIGRRLKMLMLSDTVAMTEHQPWDRAK